MRLKQEILLALQEEMEGLLCPGDSLVAVGDVALAGTAAYTEAHYQKLRERFSEGFLKDALALRERYGAFLPGENPEKSRVIQMAKEAGASAWIAMGKGGFLCALWKMAEASQVGLNADFRRIPIRQETIEICEMLDENPYRLDSEGALLIGVPGGHALAEAYLREGIPAAVIGEATASNDRLLYSGENARYLERPPAEDWFREKNKEEQ